MATRKKAPISRSRRHIHEPVHLGDQIADRITSFVGSWPFVGIHICWFILWILLRFEPFPFGLLTLVVSLEAIFLSTFVMMSQNRSAAKDHIRDDHEAKEVDELFKINGQQLQILNQLNVSNAQQTKILELLQSMNTSTPTPPDIDPDSTLNAHPARRNLYAQNHPS